MEINLVNHVQETTMLPAGKVPMQTLTGGKAVSANAWQSEDKQWRYALTEQGDLMITHVSQAGRVVVRRWSAMQGQQGSPLGLSLEQSAGAQPPAPAPTPTPEPEPEPEPGMYALRGGQTAPDGEWQLQGNGSIPGAQVDYSRNDLMVGGQDSFEAPGTFRRIMGVALGSDGKLHSTMANTRAVSFWGLGDNDFMSGEQYDDYLDGGDGGDLIWGGAGSDTIRGGAGNDIIVTNMAATHETFQENPFDPGYMRGPDNEFTYFGAQTNFMGRWWVEKSDDGLNLKIPRAYVKNPEGSNTYWIENRDGAFTAYLIAACDVDTCVSGRLGVRPANEAQWWKAA